MQRCSPFLSMAFFFILFHVVDSFFFPSYSFRYTWVPAFMMPIKIKVIFLHQIIMERLVTICWRERRKKECRKWRKHIFFSVELKEKGHIYLSNYYSTKKVWWLFIFHRVFFHLLWISVIAMNERLVCEMKKNVNIISGLCFFYTVLVIRSCQGRHVHF